MKVCVCRCKKQMCEGVLGCRCVQHYAKIYECLRIMLTVDVMQPKYKLIKLRTS